MHALAGYPTHPPSLLGSVGRLLLAGCNEFGKAAGKDFFIDLKAALLSVDMDLSEKGLVTEKTLERLRKVYAGHQTEYGKSKTYEMLAFFIETVDYAMHPSAEKPGRYERVHANKKILLNTIDAEFPGH
jgi:hypothetical protein